MSKRDKKLEDAKPVPRARKGRGQQRQRLIDACISALHIFGPSRTTVEKVVAIAKMSPGIVRFYFDSKAAMLVASLQFLAAEFEEQVLGPVEKLKSRPVAALQLMVDLYLDPDIASPRKVSVWYAFWGEASSRQEYYDICGQKDESFAALVRELIGSLIAKTAQPQLDPDAVALGLIGVLEMLWQDFAFQTERNIDRTTAKKRCMAYLRSLFPGQFPAPDAGPASAAAELPVRFPGAAYEDAGTHAAERELLFQSGWTVIGHESQVSRPGDFLAVDIGTERALLVRDAAGLHALRNSCPAAPHALVAEGGGRFDGRMCCRLHGLVFSLNGRGQDAARADLGVLDSASIGGWVLARAPQRDRSPQRTGTPETLLHELPPPGLMSVSAGVDIAVAADWKVVVELWLEASRPVSPGSVEEPLRWRVEVPDAGWSARHYRRLVECVEPSVWGRQFMPPNQLLESRPDGWSVLQAMPESPGRCRVRRLDYTVLAPEAGARAALYLASRLGSFVRRGTLDAAESIQQGMTRFGYGNSQRAVPPAVAWFRRWLAARVPALAGAAPRSGAAAASVEARLSRTLGPPSFEGAEDVNILSHCTAADRRNA